MADTPATTQLSGSTSPRVAELSKYGDELEDQVQMLHAEIRDLTGNIRRQTNRIEVSADALHAAAAKYDDEAEDVRLEEAADAARFGAITDAIARLSKQSAAQVSTDPVVTQLQKVVDARQDQMDAINHAHQMGQVSEREVDAAAAAVAEAKAQLALQRQQASAAAGGDMLSALEKELISVTIDRQECEAKMKMLDAEGKGLAQAVDEADQITPLQAELDHCQAELEKVQEQRDQARIQLDVDRSRSR